MLPLIRAAGERVDTRESLSPAVSEGQRLEAQQVGHGVNGVDLADSQRHDRRVLQQTACHGATG